MKVGGTYPSIVNGVSEKQPQHRLPGQTTRQVNMLSDPVHGLVRRRGTRYAARIAASLSEAARAELANMDVFDFTMKGKEYALLYRRRARENTGTPFAFLYDKTDETFVPITYENSTWVDDLIAGGASSVVAMGDYVYIAGNTNIPAATQTNLWDVEENHNKLGVWFRTGKYSTTYKVKLIREDGTFMEKEYTTKPAAYPEVLDTSDIEFYLPGTTDPDPEYQKHVNDRVNEYNGNVNAWTKEAAEDIVPENIAEQLAEEFNLEGVFVTPVENGGLLFDDEEFVDIEVDDGGDNTTVYAVGQMITDATRVTKYHFHGKIVRVQPSGGGADEAYYLEARLENGETSGHGAVAWYETAGVSAEITGFVSQLIVHEGAGYVARDGAGLSSIAPTSGDHPEYKMRVTGDGLTAPLPWFVGKPITMLAAFQDRLIVGTENYVNASKAQDYLNFFRGSVLTTADNDPIEIFAHGSEGDVLRHSVLYNGNLVIFGDRQQYGISGDSLFTPRSPLIRAISANRNAVDARPMTSGNFIFYAQHGYVGTTLHQLRVGSINGQETITDELSDDLGNWLNGTPVQIVPLTAPNVVMFRTEGHLRDFYLYQYVDDKNDGRRHQSAWSTFEYHEALGTILAVSSHRKSALVFSARDGYVVCDVASFDGAPYEQPYVDSRVPFADRDEIAVDEDEAAAVVGPGHEALLLGTPMDRYDEFIAQVADAEPFLVYGVVSPALVTPTNPFPRDQNGQAVLDGRMTLNRVSADVEDTGGFIADVESSSGVTRTTDFEGRILGNSMNLIGRQPTYTGQLNISVGREVRDCSYTIRSKGWLPLRVTGLAWVGQLFNHVRRVS